MPLSYIFDDHDFGSNNANATSRSAPHANNALSNIMYFEDKQEEGYGKYHSFRVPLKDKFVLFVVFDLRSYKDNVQNYGEA